MKIGIDARMYRSSVAGIGRYSQNLIKNLLEIDCENEYILFMTLEDAEEYQKLNIKNQNAFSRPNAKIKIVEIPHFSFAEQTKLSKIIEKENLDLMHFLNFNHPVSYKGKFITTIHDLTLFFYPETARDTNFVKFLGFKYVMKKSIKNSSKIIAVSENTKKDIVKLFKISPEKIKVIYEASDDKIINDDKENTDRLQKKYNITEPIILYVGQFREHKNLRRLFEAFEIIRRQIDCKLVVLGNFESTRKKNLLLDKIDFTKDIVMPGFVSDDELVAWYKIADCFVMPSLYEGFGLPGLEAMQAGLSVVSSNKASLPEIYQNGALYFDPFNSKDIAVKIKEVLVNKDLKKQLIENGQRVRRKYSWRKTAEETLELYKEIKAESEKRKT